MSQLFGTDIRHASLIRASPSRVYDAFTTAREMDGWFTSGAVIEPRAGGEIRFRWVDWGPDRINCEDGGPVLEAHRPEQARLSGCVSPATGIRPRVGGRWQTAPPVGEKR